MKGICPNCEKETELNFVNAIEEIMVRGEAIPTNVEYLKCEECGSEFRDPSSQKDPLETAYREYRQRHVMLQPEKIRELREQYGLTQQEMSNLLGWGGATLSRYENGALQDEAHETILRLIQEPHNLLELIEQKPGALEEKKKERATACLKEIAHIWEKSFITIYENLFGSYKADKYSGYKTLDISKLLNSMIFFCKDANVPKTKLNKLIFYADFKHFKDYTISITGVKFAHLPYGPAPDNYQLYVAALHDEEKSVSIEELQFPNGYTGEYLRAIKEPVLSIFSTTELKVLAMVKEYFAESTAKQISDLSHQEKGYQDTRDGELISYDYAQYLSI
jgi:putative zinc finger/helix-turn-helix YgiT family protein